MVNADAPKQPKMEIIDGIRVHPSDKSTWLERHPREKARTGSVNKARTASENKGGDNGGGSAA